MMNRTSLLRAAVGALMLSAPAAGLVGAPTVALAQSRAHGDMEAESFIQTQASRVLEVLNDRSMGLEAKKQTFRGMVDQVADVPRITGFVLGRYRRIVTPDQYAAFSAAFREYADNVYESRLGQYSGQTLRVTGSIVRQPGDVVVTSEVRGGNSAPTVVNWRVIRGSDGRYKAVDVQVEGVWLAITEQQDFVSTLDNHNGDINVLINQLRRQSGGGGRGR
jgi:phospholipid transport system substrate-binding protein